MRDNRRPSEDRCESAVTGADGAVPSREPNHADGARLVTDGGRPALDPFLKGLSRERNRHVLYYLAENERVEFDELVDAVAGQQTEGSTPSEGFREKTRILLHHTRLPKLEDLGIVEYDERAGVVRYRDPPPHFEEFLNLARELDEG